MDGHEAAAEVCRLAGASSLLEWLELPASATSADALVALRARRRKLQALQGSPKHREMARLVIKRFRVLVEVVDDLQTYRELLLDEHRRSRLPLLDIGVDGVLADGTVTEEELAFLHETARRLGLDPNVALGRLRLRAQAKGVSLAPPAPARSSGVLRGPVHPLLPKDWWDDAVSRWLVGQLPMNTRKVVEPRCGDGASAAALLGLRNDLRYVGFDEPMMAARAEATFEMLGLHGAAAMPSSPHALPLDDGAADVVLFMMHGPDSAELAEARRVTRGPGHLLVVTPGVPRITLDGPVPALDGALWGLVRAALLVPNVPGTLAASTHVVTRTVVGGRSVLVATVLQQVAAIQRLARLQDHHPAIRRLAHALESFGEGPDGVGSYEVPLVARTL